MEPVLERFAKKQKGANGQAQPTLVQATINMSQMLEEQLLSKATKAPASASAGGNTTTGVKRKVFGTKWQGNSDETLKSTSNTRESFDVVSFQTMITNLPPLHPLSQRPMLMRGKHNCKIGDQAKMSLDNKPWIVEGAQDMDLIAKPLDKPKKQARGSTPKKKVLAPERPTSLLYPQFAAYAPFVHLHEQQATLQGCAQGIFPKGIEFCEGSSDLQRAPMLLFRDENKDANFILLAESVVELKCNLLRNNHASAMLTLAFFEKCRSILEQRQEQQTLATTIGQSTITTNVSDLDASTKRITAEQLLKKKKKLKEDLLALYLKTIREKYKLSKTGYNNLRYLVHMGFFLGYLTNDDLVLNGQLIECITGIIFDPLEQTFWFDNKHIAQSILASGHMVTEGDDGEQDKELWIERMDSIPHRMLAAAGYVSTTRPLTTPRLQQQQSHWIYCLTCSTTTNLSVALITPQEGVVTEELEISLQD